MAKSNKKKRKSRTPAPKAAAKAVSTPSPAASGSRLPPWKKAVFGLATTVFFFCLLEGVLWVGGVETISFRDDPYVGFSSYAPLFVPEQADSGSAGQLTTAANKVDWFNRQKFLHEKPAGVYRVFCLGGSTTYGRPYYDKTSFAAWLRAFLPAADSSRDWEVINAGGISYASYRVARLMEELIEYQPDLFIVYSGHNEFLENRTYGSIIETPEAIRDFDSVLTATRTYSVIRRVLRGENGRAHRDRNSTTEALPEEVETILDDAVGLDIYRRDQSLQQQIFAHYRYNLLRMAEIARSAGAEILFVTPASNLRSCTPFKSEHKAGLNEPARLSARDHFEAARRAAQDSRQAEALQQAAQAVAIDDQYANWHYYHGQLLWRAGRFDDAHAAFLRARDEDICPLRALTPMIDIVREVAQQANVPLVDFVNAIGQRADHATPGDDWFLDHVHPTVAGHRLLGRMILDRLEQLGVVRFQESWNEAAAQRVVERIEQTIDPREHATALRNLSKVLSWAGKKEDAERLAVRALELLPDDAEAQYQAAGAYSSRGQFEKAIDCYRKSLALRPNSAKTHFGLAKALAGNRNVEEAIAQYEQALVVDPNYDHAHHNLARIYEAAGQMDRAEQHYRQAISINAEHFNSRINLGSLLARKNELEEAEEQFIAALAAKPDFAHAHANLGTVRQLQGEAVDAANSFRAALRHEPGHFLAAYNLVTLLATHPDPAVRNGAEAVRWAERLADAPEMARFWQGQSRATEYQQPAVLSLLAAAYAEAGNFEKAAQTQQSAIDLAPVGMRAEYRERLEGYRRGEPLRQ